MARRTIFADSFYWIALIHPRDAHHLAVLSFSRSLGMARIVTTDEVLCEVPNYYSAFGPYWRRSAAALVRQVRVHPGVEVLAQSRTNFDAAFQMYEARLDKDFSVTDCRSMIAMTTCGLTDVLTNDHHFTQAGFTILFP